MSILCVSVILIFLANVNSSFAVLNSTNEEIINEAGDVLFVLYTRNNPVKEELFRLNSIDKLKNSNFNADKKVKILIHGWKGSYTSSFAILIKNAFLIQYDANVIVVDWKEGAKKWYNESRSKVPYIARAVAYMIDKLVATLNIDPSNIHIVGHSLGAHIAGITGMAVTSGQVGRVTGLDPAGPLFSMEDRLRIGQHSAKFVDIIHTDSFSAGFSENLGHVDFYPNGGIAIQPGCGMDIGTLKSHRRAYWLFAESIITPGGFKAISCYNWMAFKLNVCPPQSNITEMGEHVSKEARGSYYLITNDRTPFALGNASLSDSYI